MRLLEKSRSLGRFFYLYYQTANVRQRVVNDGNETGIISIVDYAVVEGERNRQYQTRYEFFIILYRFYRGFGNVEDSYFRRVYNRREVGSIQVVDVGDGEVIVLYFVRSQFIVTRFFRNSYQFARQFDDVFFVDVFEYRNNQIVRGIYRYIDVDVFFQGQTLIVFRQRIIEARYLFKSCSNGFYDEDNRGDFYIQFTFRRFFVLLFTERF